MMDERTIDNAAAKPFKMLSAYFMTAATTNPPRAFRVGREGKRGGGRGKGHTAVVQLGIISTSCLP